MKKKISLLLAVVMIIAMMPTNFAATRKVNAVKSNQKFALYGEEVKLGSYLIEGSNYVKLRDVAAIMNDTVNRFNVSWDDVHNKIRVNISWEYKKQSGDLEEVKDNKAKATLSTQIIDDDISDKEVKTANINGNNYIQLRDIAKLIGFGVDYDKATNTVLIDTLPMVTFNEDLYQNQDKAKIKVIPENEWTEAEKLALEKIKKNYEKNFNILDNYVKIGDVGYNTAEWAADDIYDKGEKYGCPTYLKDTIFDLRVEEMEGQRYCLLHASNENGYNYYEKAILNDKGYIKERKEDCIVRYKMRIREGFDKTSLTYAEIAKALIEFQDAVVDEDYKKASEALYRIGYNATEEKTREYVELKKTQAKRMADLGGENTKKSKIFIKDNSVEINYLADGEDYNDRSGYYGTFYKVNELNLLENKKFNDKDDFSVVYFYNAYSEDDYNNKDNNIFDFVMYINYTHGFAIDLVL